MFKNLQRVFARPHPFEFYTTETLWNDPHISSRMLAVHLDEDSELASRPKAVIEASVDWVAQRFDLGPGRRVCDLGCGPGLYTMRFARTGATVTGIDFSERSIDHARQAAEVDGLPIDYRLGNYLEIDPAGPFDLITLIFFDFCVLSPAQRTVLLAKMRDSLAEGGEILLDVVSRRYFETTAEKYSFEACPDGGFWSAGPHYVFQTSFKYDEEALFLEKYLIVEDGRTREIYNWIQCHDLAAMKAEFAAAGLEIVETYGTVAGAAHDPDGSEFAVVARRAG